jgi:RNA polymerase sigma-70 factor (ECF subfamily)
LSRDRGAPDLSKEGDDPLSADWGTELAEKYRMPLIRYFSRRVASAAEAEDLTHEVLLNVLTKTGAQRLDNPDGFLFRSAFNLLRDRARNARVRRESQTDLANIEWQENLSPERIVQGKEALIAAINALMELPEKTRDILLLHRLEGLKYAEIAALYGVSSSAIEKHLIKGFAHLSRYAKRSRFRSDEEKR